MNDYNNEETDGKFYEKELQRSNHIECGFGTDLKRKKWQTIS